MIAQDTSATAVAELCEHAAAASVAWWRLGARRRAFVLDRVASAIEHHRNELTDLAAAETSLPVARLDGEIDRTASQLRLLAERGIEVFETFEQEDGHIRVHRPIGPVAVYAASNFPFAFSVAGTDTASALAAGCTVVVKTHPGHPETSEATARVVRAALRECDVPDGVFSTVSGFDAGRTLVSDSRIRAAAFTGSLAGGRALFDEAARRQRPIPFYGELGSVNPVVVTPAAWSGRRTGIVRGFVDSFLVGRGQFCTKPGIVFLPHGHAIENELRELVSGSSTASLLTPGIEAGFREGVDTMERLAERLTPPDEPGAVFATDAERFLERPELREEVFGPAALIVSYADEDQLSDAIAAIEGSLTATIHAEPEDAALSRRLVEELSSRVGRVVWNGWPTGVRVDWTMHHGGPWPATTNALHTSVGAHAIDRFVVPVVYQGVPKELIA